MASIRLSGLISIAILALVAGCQQQEPVSENKPAGRSIPIGSGFDFYVLALSWSPGYCASMGDRANRQQCGDGADYGLVVHGLWPQFNDGYPENCQTNEPLSVSGSLSDSMLDIMPSSGLIEHEWKKHGTCSGLSQRDYFSVLREAFSGIKSPALLDETSARSRSGHQRIEDAFLNANPQFSARNVAVTCDRRFLRDIRICIKKDLSGPVDCPQVDRAYCQLDQMVIVPRKD